MNGNLRTPDAGTITVVPDTELALHELGLSPEEITVRALLGQLREHDDLSARHSERVASLAVELGRALGLGAQDLQVIRLGALTHDLGKIHIPRDILQKPGPLDEGERREINRHPLYGYNIMTRDFPGLSSIADIALYHHERWDGNGYPLGIKATEIPFAARIVAVADVFDALTNDRPYEAAWPAYKALNHLAKQAGRQFDPRVVEVFLTISAAASTCAALEI